jgi:hypothetical protein
MHHWAGHRPLAHGGPFATLVPAAAPMTGLFLCQDACRRQHRHDDHSDFLHFVTPLVWLMMEE